MTELAASSPSAEPRRAAPALAFMLLRRATANFLEDRASQLAAGISYFALFSLFSFTLLVFAVFGLVLRDDDLQADVLSAVVDAIPIEDDFIADALGALAEQGATIRRVRAARHALVRQRARHRAAQHAQRRL